MSRSTIYRIHTIDLLKKGKKNEVKERKRSIASDNSDTS